MDRSKIITSLIIAPLLIETMCSACFTMVTMDRAHSANAINLIRKIFWYRA
jgi:hypothetical protein